MQTIGRRNRATIERVQRELETERNLSVLTVDRTMASISTAGKFSRGKLKTSSPREREEDAESGRREARKREENEKEREREREEKLERLARNRRRTMVVAPGVARGRGVGGA